MTSSPAAGGSSGSSKSSGSGRTSANKRGKSGAAKKASSSANSSGNAAGGAPAKKTAAKKTAAKKTTTKKATTAKKTAAKKNAAKRPAGANKSATPRSSTNTAADDAQRETARRTSTSGSNDQSAADERTSAWPMPFGIGGPPPELPDVGEFIRTQRENAKLSIRRLAELADVSNPYLSQVERGLRKPSADILQQLATALRISVESLYVRAGLLSAEEHNEVSVLDAIEHDPFLTDEQKAAVRGVYLSFVNPT